MKRGQRQRNWAFTLIEMLVVVTCIVLLVAIAMYALAPAAERARIATCAANLRSIHQALSGYAIDYLNWYPLHGAKDDTTFTADVSAFSGGTGYWFGDANYQGTSNYQRPTENSSSNGRLGNVGIGQALLNGGAYAGKGKFKPGKAYLTNPKVFYCPNQADTTFFAARSGGNLTYSVLDPVAPFDGTSDVVIKTLSSPGIWGYYSIPVNQRYANALPEIGYSATNGNSPGYAASIYGPSDIKMKRYQGKYVYDSNGALFNGKDATPWTNEQFAAGFMTDAPRTIILADVALITNAGSGASTVQVEIGRRGRSDHLEVSHDSGINTLYNGGNVGFMSFGGDTLQKSKIYYGNAKGATVFGPR